MSTTKFAHSVPWVLFLTLMVFFSIFPRLLMSPLLLRISQDFEVGFDAASRLFLTMSAGFIVGLLSSGFVATRLTHRWTVALAVGLGGVMMIAVGLAPSLPLLHAAIVIAGLVTGLYPGSGVASVASLVPDFHRGKALAIHETGPNLAFILAPLVSAAAAPVIGWRGVVTAAGAAAIVVAAAFAVFGKADDQRSEPPHFKNVGFIIRNRSFWVVSLLLTVAAMAAMGVYSILPTYMMVDHGLAERLVNTVIGASRVIAFAAILSAGVFADRFGFHAVVLVIMVLTGAATILIGVGHGAVLIIAVFLQPAIVGAFFPVGVSALTNIGPPQMRNLSVALAIPMANLAGGGLAPTVLSSVGAAGNFRAAFVVLGLVILASVALLPLMEREPRGS